MATDDARTVDQAVSRIREALAIARELEIPPYPLLFAEVFASNIGGTATLIGDPPNILIGSLVDLSFNDFVKG